MATSVFIRFSALSLSVCLNIGWLCFYVCVCVREKFYVYVCVFFLDQREWGDSYIDYSSLCDANAFYAKQGSVYEIHKKHRKRQMVRLPLRPCSDLKKYFKKKFTRAKNPFKFEIGFLCDPQANVACSLNWFASNCFLHCSIRSKFLYEKRIRLHTQIIVY